MNEQVLISTIQTLSQEIGKEIAEKHITMAEVNLFAFLIHPILPVIFDFLLLTD